MITVSHDSLMFEGEPTLSCTSFCTASACYRHDACSVWAHLIKVLEFILKESPNINSIHFQSDGPATQYRNKTNFILLTHFAKKLGLKEATWSFSESGHGKGSADGVGAVVKRAADQVVAHGADISSCSMLLKSLLDAHLKVKVLEVLETDLIDMIDSLIPRKPQKPVPNTMKIKQLIWTDIKPKTLGLRYLSCITCGSNLCNHFSLNPREWTFDEMCSTAAVVTSQTCTEPPLAVKRKSKKELRTSNIQVTKPADRNSGGSNDIDVINSILTVKSLCILACTYR